MGNAASTVTKLRAETRSAKELDEKRQSNMPGGNSYANYGGALYLLKETEGGARKTKLTNFTAQIVSETVKSDGLNRENYLTITGSTEDGHVLPQCDVPATEFSKLEWIAREWGCRPQIGVGPRFGEHFVAAVRSLSKPVQSEVFVHTGWVEQGAEYYYLSASGGIGRNGLSKTVRAELKQSLGDVDLPAPDRGEIEDTEEVFERLEGLIKGSTALLLFGAVPRSILSHFDPATTSIFLQGVTGTYKSMVAGVIQSFFGKKYHGFHLPENWSSTGNAIERKAFLMKDSVMVVDDFVARGTPNDVARIHSAAERLIRSQGNQAGRDRLNSQAQLKGAYHSRGLILATGEDLPNGHSLQARMVIVSIERGSVDLGCLTALQSSGNVGTLAQLTALFAQWVAKKAHSALLITMIKEAHEINRAAFVRQGHARMADNLSQLVTGVELFFEFAVEERLVSPEFARSILEKAKGVALALARLQIDVDRESSDARRFVAYLRTAVSTGRAHIQSKQGGEPANPLVLGWHYVGAEKYRRLEGQGPCVGWADDEVLYIEPRSALSVIKSVSTSLGDHLGSTERAIGKALREAGFLQRCDDGRNTAKISLAGERRHVYCFRLSDVFDLDPVTVQMVYPDTSEIPF